MALNDAALNLMADALAGAVTHLALHDGPAEVDECSTARQIANWAAATGGDLALTAGDAFTGTASAPVTEVGLWSALTGGTFYGTVEITTGDLAFNASGGYTLNTLTLNGSTN